MATDRAPIDQPVVEEKAAQRTSANRIVALTVATACMFGFTSFLQDGTWIFPFPIYDIGMLISVLVLFIAGRKKPDAAVWLAVTWAFLQIFSSQFFIEILLSERQLQSYFESSVPDVFHVLAAIVFLIWGVALALRMESQRLRRSIISSFVIFSLAWMIGLSPYLQYYLGLLDTGAMVSMTELLIYFAALPLVVIVGLLVTGREKIQPHFHILLIFTFFYLTEYGTLLFFGK